MTPEAIQIGEAFAQVAGGAGGWIFALILFRLLLQTQEKLETFQRERAEDAERRAEDAERRLEMARWQGVGADTKPIPPLDRETRVRERLGAGGGGGGGQPAEMSRI